MSNGYWIIAKKMFSNFLFDDHYVQAYTVGHILQRPRANQNVVLHLQYLLLVKHLAMCSTFSVTDLAQAILSPTFFLALKVTYTRTHVRTSRPFLGRQPHQPGIPGCSEKEGLLIAARYFFPGRHGHTPTSCLMSKEWPEYSYVIYTL